MRGLTEREKLEILRSSSTNLLQSNCLSLRMTNVENVSNNSRHPERSEGSFTDSIWINPSPQSSPQGEEAVGRVQGAIWEKCAFTLAEVLITLGIIGVVTAMTIPTLMANVKAHQYSAKFKKTVSTLSNAAKMSQTQYGFDFSGINEVCTANSATDNPEDKQSICSLLNGTLTGATYYYGMDRPPNYSINKSQSPTYSLSSFSRDKNYIPIYFLADGTLILFSAVLGGSNTIIEASCSRTLGNTNPGIIQEGEHRGWGTGCYALIDVNGISKPNKEVKCTRGSNKILTMEAGNCIVEPKDMSDIFPVIIYDGSVSPFLQLLLMPFHIQNRKIRGLYFPRTFCSYL